MGRETHRTERKTRAMPQGIDLLPVVIPGETVRKNPFRETDDGSGTDTPYVLVVYDDSWHTFDEVEVQLQKATGCTLEKAEALAIEIDAAGRARVFHGSGQECERVAGVLRQIRLQVETDRA